MSRYKGRAGAKQIEKDFPDFVETQVPLGGFKNKLNEIFEWHARCCVRTMNSTWRSDENNRDYVRC
jgi:hypothetical protein